MKITGTLTVKGDVSSYGANNFQKRDIVITTVEQYPQHIKLELQQDRTDLIDPYELGENLTVDFNLKGRKHTNSQGEDNYYNTLVAWKVQRFQG